jgi:membrane-associated HD superfamily phosphohydrolase
MDRQQSFLVVLLWLAGVVAALPGYVQQYQNKNQSQNYNLYIPNDLLCLFLILFPCFYQAFFVVYLFFPVFLDFLLFIYLFFLRDNHALPVFFWFFCLPCALNPRGSTRIRSSGRSPPTLLN